jgi:hypothetical protein
MEKLGEEYESPLEKILFGLYEKNKNEKIKMPPFTRRRLSTGTYYKSSRNQKHYYYHIEIFKETKVHSHNAKDSKKIKSRKWRQNKENYTSEA